MTRFLYLLSALRDCVRFYRMGYSVKVLPEGKGPMR